MVISYYGFWDFFWVIVFYFDEYGVVLVNVGF